MTQLLRLHCATCDTAITEPIAEVRDLDRLCLEDGEAFVPRGHYVVSDGTYYTGSEGHPITNLADLCNTTRHTDLHRLNGCCGLDGCDGMNTLCINGHEVGTECSDCWMAHGIHFDPELVVLKNAT